MILLDFNVLVYAHREDAARHVEFRRWLEATLDSPSGCAVSELVLSGCLRVLTHPRVFDPPTPLELLALGWQQTEVVVQPLERLDGQAVRQVESDVLDCALRLEMR